MGENGRERALAGRLERWKRLGLASPHEDAFQHKNHVRVLKYRELQLLERLFHRRRAKQL